MGGGLRNQGSGMSLNWKRRGIWMVLVMARTTSLYGGVVAPVMETVVNVVAAKLVVRIFLPVASIRVTLSGLAVVPRAAVAPLATGGPAAELVTLTPMVAVVEP